MVPIDELITWGDHAVMRIWCGMFSHAFIGSECDTVKVLSTSLRLELSRPYYDAGDCACSI